MKHHLCLLFLVYSVFAQTYQQACLNSPVVDPDNLSGPYEFSFVITQPAGDAYFCIEQPDVQTYTEVRMLRIDTNETPYALTIDTCGSVADNGWAILTHPSQQCVADADDTVCWKQFVTPSSTGTCTTQAAGGSEVVTYPLGQDQVYILSFYGTGLYGGTGLGYVEMLLSFTPIAAPVNDLCDSAIEIAPRAYITGTTDGAGFTSNTFTSTTFCPVSSFSVTSPDVWYTFNSGNSPAAYVYSCGGFDTDFASIVYLSSGGCDGASRPCLSNVLAPGDCEFTGSGSLYYTNLTPNTDYLISITGVSGTTGNFFFFLYLAPDNSLCSAAMEITSLPFTYTGSLDAAPADNRCDSNTNAAYFKINTRFGVFDAVFDTCNSNFDTTAALSLSCSGECLGETDDGCPSGTGTRFAYPNGVIPPNTDVYIRVAAKTFALNSTYTVQLTGTFADANGACSRAQTVTSLPYSFTGDARGAESVSICGITPTAASWFSFNTGGGYPALTFTATSQSFPLYFQIVSSCGGNCLAQGLSPFTLQNVAANQQWLIAVTGAQGAYSFSITGITFTTPVVICPSDLVVTASPSTCRYSGTTGIPSVIAVDGSPTTVSKSPRGPYPIGVTNVVFSAINLGSPNRVGTCTQQVTVNAPANSQC